ncbi:molybdate ABC transporter substrate-binding protein [Clostridium sp. Marseille-Q2269]|uniref:molybdate ABC transporter substrate-binding protein n=1 Tax=Clostridium sp. Marseille-Q2269 TaxID=2942205 RepID=UPI00207351AD|nr:molybdate ABC transporter substrate-binding protein [Clostridium sp. Marseille-Q2269]
MMKGKKVLAVITMAVTLGTLVGCGKQQTKATNTENAKKQEITVSAAASLKESLESIEPIFEKETGVKVNFNFASSGTLQKQIEQGSPIDLFISAGKKQMDQLESKNLTVKDSRKDLLENDLVLISSNEYKNEIKNINDIILKNKDMSIGTVESVPAGEYGKEALTSLKLWDKLKDKLIYAKDVKQVANYVDNKEVASGIVYKSDAMELKNSYIVQTFHSNTHKPIVYPCAVISNSKKKEIAKKFMNYLKSKESIKIFEKKGFKIGDK